MVAGNSPLSNAQPLHAVSETTKSNSANSTSNSAAAPIPPTLRPGFFKNTTQNPLPSQPGKKIAIKKAIPHETTAKVENLVFQNPANQHKFVSDLLRELKLHHGWFSDAFPYSRENMRGFFSQPKVILSILSSLLEQDFEPYKDVFYLEFLVRLQREFPRTFLKAVLGEKMNPSPAWIQQVKEHPFEGKESLMQLQEVLKGKATFLTFLTAHPGTYPFSLLKELLPFFSVEPLHLGWALCLHQHELLEVLLEHLPENHFKTSPKSSHVCLTYILYYENWGALDKLFSKGLDISQAYPFLQEAVEEGLFPFVAWILEHGFRIPDQNKYDELILKARNAHHLGIIRTLCQKITQAGIQPAFYPEVLNFHSENAQSSLQAWLLFSPLEEIYALAQLEQFSSLHDYLPDLIKTLSFCVRFPRPQYRLAINTSFGNTTTYIQSTWKYAEQNRQLAEQLLPNLSKMTWRELLDKIVNDRVNRGQLDSKKKLFYQTRRTDTQSTERLSTWILNVSSDLHTTPGCCQYSPSLSLFRNYIDEKKISLFSTSANPTMTIQPSDSEKIGMNYGLSYTIHYMIPETKKMVPVTIMSCGALIRGGPYKLVWRHPSNEVIKTLERHQEDLYRKLVDSQPEDEATRKELRIRNYYLPSTLCEIERGTPHNVLIWLNLIYMHEKLPPPIPRLNHFYLDNAMLNLPIEEAIQKWDSFFEPLYLPTK